MGRFPYSALFINCIDGTQFFENLRHIRSDRFPRRVVFGTHGVHNGGFRGFFLQTVHDKGCSFFVRTISLNASAPTGTRNCVSSISCVINSFFSFIDYSFHIHGARGDWQRVPRSRHTRACPHVLRIPHTTKRWRSMSRSSSSSDSGSDSGPG